MWAKAVAVVAGVVMTVFLGPSAQGDVDDCQNAISKYKSAVNDISDALQQYASCVSGSEGHDDCSGQFSALQSAQSDFEDAVSAYNESCN